MWFVHYARVRVGRGERYKRIAFLLQKHDNSMLIYTLSCAKIAKQQESRGTGGKVKGTCMV